jgi:hypothetical protein
MSGPGGVAASFLASTARRKQRAVFVCGSIIGLVLVVAFWAEPPETSDISLTTVAVESGAGAGGAPERLMDASSLVHIFGGPGASAAARFTLQDVNCKQGRQGGKAGSSGAQSPGVECARRQQLAPSPAVYSRPAPDSVPVSPVSAQQQQAQQQQQQQQQPAQHEPSAAPAAAPLAAAALQKSGKQTAPPNKVLLELFVMSLCPDAAFCQAVFSRLMAKLHPIVHLQTE